MSTQKYRIVSKLNYQLISPTFFIQRKFFFFWLTIQIKENRESKDLDFVNYEEAENYMRQHYFKADGIVFKPIINEYHYSEFDYSY